MHMQTKDVIFVMLLGKFARGKCLYRGIAWMPFRKRLLQLLDIYQVHRVISKWEGSYLGIWPQMVHEAPRAVWGHALKLLLRPVLGQNTCTCCSITLNENLVQSCSLGCKCARVDDNNHYQCVVNYEQDWSDSYILLTALTYEFPH